MAVLSLVRAQLAAGDLVMAVRPGRSCLAGRVAARECRDGEGHRAVTVLVHDGGFLSASGMSGQVPWADPRRFGSSAGGPCSSARSVSGSQWCRGS